ncbi:MAG: putative DNA modification/repair radical SAM protein [Methylobacillus glycogenes]|nr:putative DNA modification/repair radical SAM protein [Methylobacillus glycogenes]
MLLKTKLEILADAAKYDASCASSGTERRNSSDGAGIGSTEGMGICHSYAPDGRCISLLKILLTNFCLYECVYCVNRASSNVKRARFSVDEVVKLTLSFYQRNYIEGLFLSSGIIQNSDYTMEQVVEVARVLREEHDFRGYIHLKTIPDASDELLAKAGLYADRLSINVELPTQASLKQLAPEKDGQRIAISMDRLRSRIEAAKDRSHGGKRPARFSPGGQSTQMIIGADNSDDRTILAASSSLYQGYRLRRVYYSAFSPIPDSSQALPLKSPPLVREHRLYQADWLLRFYGYQAEEITAHNSMLDLELDPKTAWAVANRQRFPVDINRAEREMLLRVPGMGPASVLKILKARRWRRIRLDDLARMRLPIKRMLPFILVADHQPGAMLEATDLRMQLLANQQQQLDLFAQGGGMS